MQRVVMAVVNSLEGVEVADADVTMQRTVQAGCVRLCGLVFQGAPSEGGAAVSPMQNAG
jgi:hypothetical protein